MWTFLFFIFVSLILFVIYSMNIGLVRVQLEELTHRYQKGDSRSGDLEEWEYYLNKLFRKPFGTRKPILFYGDFFQRFLEDKYPQYNSYVLSKYKRFVKKHR